MSALPALLFMLLTPAMAEPIACPQAAPQTAPVGSQRAFGDDGDLILRKTRRMLCEWDENGRLTRELHWNRDGQKHGIETTKHNGTLVAAGHWNAGVRQGQWQIKEDDLTSTGHYTGGVKSGEWFTYDGTGELARTELWQADTLRQTATWHAGELDSLRSFSPDGVLNGPYYDVRGHRTDLGAMTNGRRSGEWRFLHSGKLYERGDYVDGRKHGLWIHINADWRFETTFKNGLEEGAFRRYVGGLLQEEGSYHRGLQHGAWLTNWPGTEIPRYLLSFDHGQREGPHSYWDEQGRLTRRGLLTDGKWIAEYERPE